MFSVVLIAPGDIVLSEIMYNPDGPTLGEDEFFEWVELCNLSEIPVELYGMMLSDGGNQIFLDDFTLEPLARVVVPADEQSFAEAYGYSVPVVTWEGVWTKLSNSGDTLLLYSAYGEVIDELVYSDGWGLPEGDTTRSEADGRGSSLEKIDLWGDNSENNWIPSIDWACPGVDPETGDPVCWGTPGEMNTAEY